MAKSHKTIEAFRSELFRWNSQINLVSRQETEDKLEGLFNQCLGGVEAVLNSPVFVGRSDTTAPRVYYFDLGSGGGLPGIIWHTLFSECADPDFSGAVPVQSVESWMVEPREKRAWFLKRLNRIPSMPPFGVLRGRWGDVSVPRSGFAENLGGDSVVVVSLKALHLVDSEVIDGLFASFSSFPSSFRLLIARYYPPGQVFDENLISLLKIPESGSESTFSGYTLKGKGGSVSPLGSPGLGLASLVFSPYTVTKIA